MMMKLFLLLRPNNQQSCHPFSMASRALLFTSAITPLKRMIMRTEEDPKTSVVPILENWVQQGNEIKHCQLRKLISNLTSLDRFHHALQISQWMSGKGGYELSAADYALQLELTSTSTLLYNIKKVERYFDAIPYNFRGYEVYCALLSSYANQYRLAEEEEVEECLEKCEATLQKFRDLGFVRNASGYNVILSFHQGIGDNTKMDMIAEEMREKGINYNSLTYKLLLLGNTDHTSIKRMEEVLAELEADPLVKINWSHYLVAVDGYRNAELVEKALKMLKKSEESIEGKLNWIAFETLILSYAQLGSKADVYRLWSLYKPKKGFCFRAYDRMITSLIEVGDDDGATRIWEEWLSKYSRIPKATIAAMNDTWEKKVYSDIPRVLIVGHSANLECEKVEAILSRLRESGIEADASTLDRLALAYWECEQMDKAVETFVKAISVSQPGWEPNSETVFLCLYYLKWEVDGGGVAREELCKMLTEHSGYVAAGQNMERCPSMH